MVELYSKNCYVSFEVKKLTLRIFLVVDLLKIKWFYDNLSLRNSQMNTVFFFLLKKYFKKLWSYSASNVYMLNQDYGYFKKYIVEIKKNIFYEKLQSWKKS